MDTKVALDKIVYYSDAEKRVIVSKYRSILKRAKPLLEGDDLKQIRKAFEISLDAHKEMRRRSGEPYIYHPLDVAMICVEEIGLGPTAIICALLHDVVEDTALTLDFIEREFGSKVSKIIDGLTKIAENFEQSRSPQAENFRKMLLTLSDDPRVIEIKLADRLHNMRTLHSMARNSQLKIAHETIYIYVPLAHKLGFYQIKTELEDLYLKYNEPEIYREIAQKLQANKKKREEFIERFIEPISKRLKEESEEGLDFEIKGRPKHIFSIWNKIKKKNVTFENIFDLLAIRIIVKGIPPEQNWKEKKACWEVYTIVTDEYQANPERLRDWLSQPRSNGYESLHTTVMSHTGQWVEVQIRTERMDEVAEKGYAAHWKYKGVDRKADKPLDIWVSQFRNIIHNKDRSAMEFLEDFRADLYIDEVYIFTPKGDLKRLRKGSTVLDFAYEVHTEIGNHCTAGKLNGHLVPISHVLSTGDQVQIMTTKNQKPSEDWLRFVATTKAKSRIKDALKEENNTYIDDGKATVAKRLKVLGLENNLETLNQLRAYFNKKDYNELFYCFGKGYLQAGDVKKFKHERESHENKQRKLNLDKEAYTNAKNFERAIKKSNGQDSLLIGDDMQDKVDYTLAPCCNPIPGDDVFGFTSVNEGIKIHRTNCPNSSRLLTAYGNKVIKAIWTSQVEKLYLVTIELNGINRKGIVQDVSTVTSKELNIDIDAVTLENKENLFKGYIKVYVYDTKHLEKLIRKLSLVQGMAQVTRIRNGNE